MWTKMHHREILRTYILGKPTSLAARKAAVQVCGEKVPKAGESRTDGSVIIAGTTFGNEARLDFFVGPFGQFQVVKEFVVGVHFVVSANLFSDNWTTALDFDFLSRNNPSIVLFLLRSGWLLLRGLLRDLLWYSFAQGYVDILRVSKIVISGKREQQIICIPVRSLDRRLIQICAPQSLVDGFLEEFL
jgi:hypothetical protein